ncbi:GIY-YIG nuclease family protein [Dethiobacter alkaliphilus]|uniref:GIY-YIG nuclease family protein n=1 Tax=Dethiobacter alkaliphilus TaxID=427926 RepID=UPI002227EBC5|nr:GIY-YIG nuclease family protein [Dethiobacter alkaliphilus]MCW3490960.1 GIY-YIG nuclease family protein [Dethiobacter alkaliphilus]
MAAYVYILKCADDTLYTGWTTCLKKRFKMHNSGKAAKYTRARLPVEMVWWEEYEKKEDAMRREREIKGFPRSAKMELIIAATNG